jgi:hypothetical protein
MAIAASKAWSSIALLAFDPFFARHRVGIAHLTSVGFTRKTSCHIRDYR